MIDSAGKIRTYWMLAATLMHELSHALVIATWQRPLQLFNNGPASEPFFRNQRHAEIGLAWESFALGGRTDIPGGAAKHPAAPFGLSLWLHPGIGNSLTLHDLGSAFKHGDLAEWGCLLPMQFLLQFFHMRW